MTGRPLAVCCKSCKVIFLFCALILEMLLTKRFIVPVCWNVFISLNTELFGALCSCLTVLFVED